MTYLHDLTRESFRMLLYDELEEYESTIQMLTEHLVRNPSDGIAYNNRGVAYSEIGEGEKALLDFEKAIELSPGDAMPFLNRGDLYQRARPAGGFAEAIEDYSRAISIEPDDASFHRCKAHACLKAERLQEALDSFSNAIRLEPEFRQTYLDRAQTYEQLGEKEKAKPDFQRARELPMYPSRKG